MKPVEQMDLDECREEAAEHAGWCSPVAHAPVWEAPDGRKLAEGEHPIPPTLDAIAAAMPEGWSMDYMVWPHTGGVQCSAWMPTALEANERTRKSADADTEILARARLAVLCWRAIKEPK